MWRPVIVSTAATEEPVLLAEVKQALRIDAEDEDTLIERHIKAARAYVENYTGTRLVTQTLTLRTDDWADLESLQIAPLSSVTSITYVDVDGATQTLATSVYEARLYGLEPSIVLKYNQTWPTIRVGSQITVTVVAGYGAAAATPPEIFHAICLLVGDFNRFRETAQVGSVSGKIPMAAGVEALLENHRKHLI
jgi:uncharacterized phiE125 gp8 family phage protein